MAISALVNLSDAEAGWGTIAYNGYTFPGLRDVKISGEEVYDRAGRTVIFTRYTVRVHFFVVDSGGSYHKLAMAAIRRQLQEAGQSLDFSGQGIGDLKINGSGSTHRDAEWGPKPRMVEFTQVGDVCTEVTWECVFSIKDTTSSPGPFLAFNYSVDWSYNEAGGGTRTITGYLQIPLARTPGQIGVSSSADRYREQIDPAVPIGMRRTVRDFNLSPDRSTLEFTVTDVQLDAEAPPRDCLRAELDYDIENIPPGFARYSVTLSGNIEVPVGTPTIRAAEAFVRIMLDKSAKLKKAASDGLLIPANIRFGRTIGTRTSRFSIRWWLNGCLNDLLKEGGIWDPIRDTDWAAWSNSMRASGAWSPRGTNALAYSVADDAIIDLNYGGNLPRMGSGGRELRSSPSGNHELAIQGLTKENSWLAYENSLEAIREYDMTEHRFSLPFVPSILSPGNVAIQTGIKMAELITSPNQSVAQHQGPPIDRILMTGKALRMVAPKSKETLPAVPRLVSVGGKRVEEIKSRTDGPKAIACFFGYTVFQARWAILYRVVDGYLYDIPPESNPALCCEKETA